MLCHSTAASVFSLSFFESCKIPLPPRSRRPLTLRNRSMISAIEISWMCPGLSRFGKAMWTSASHSLRSSAVNGPSTRTTTTGRGTGTVVGFFAEGCHRSPVAFGRCGVVTGNCSDSGFNILSKLPEFLRGREEEFASPLRPHNWPNPSPATPALPPQSPCFRGLWIVAESLPRTADFLPRTGRFPPPERPISSPANLLTPCSTY